MENGNRRQNEQKLRNFLGYDDAAEEQNLTKIFTPTPEYDDLKLWHKETGTFVITGLKGTGKTAMCRYIESTTPHSLIWRVDNENRFLNVHAKDLGSYPSEIESVLLNLILTELARRIVSYPASFSADGLSMIKALLPQIADHFMSFVKAGKVKAQFVEWDLEKVFASGKNKFTHFGIEPYVAPLKKCFSTKPGIILFDDVDDIFLGADSDTYPTFVEGLARAAKTINLKFGRHLHFLVFMKYGVFRAFYEKPLDYEKVRTYITVLKWNEDELERMLARRIGDKLSLDSDRDPGQVWAKILKPSTPASIKSIRRFLLDRCAGGPRDVIHYCNKAIELANKPEISKETLQACEDEFSRDKLTQIYSDYGYTYPDIHELIRKCFQGASPTYDNQGFRDFIFTKILGEQKVADLFSKHAYFERASVDELIQIFYTVGLIGYTQRVGTQGVYVLSDPRGSDLFDAVEYIIHPAFRKALRIPG